MSRVTNLILSMAVLSVIGTASPLLSIQSSVSWKPGGAPVTQQASVGETFIVTITGGTGVGWFYPDFGLSGVYKPIEHRDFKTFGAYARVDVAGGAIESGDPWQTYSSSGLRDYFPRPGYIQFTYGVPQNLFFGAYTVASIDPGGASLAGVTSDQPFEVTAYADFYGISSVSGNASVNVVDIQAMPEPSTWWTCALALIVLASLRYGDLLDWGRTEHRVAAVPEIYPAIID